MRKPKPKTKQIQPPKLGDAPPAFFRVGNAFIHINAIMMVRRTSASKGNDGVTRTYVIKLLPNLEEAPFSTVWASAEEAAGLLAWLEREAK